MTDSISIQAVAIQDQGRVRERQEDACLAHIWPGQHAALLAVADGMGGHAGGDVASQLAIDTVLAQVETLVTSLQPNVTIRLPDEPEDQASGPEDSDGTDGTEPVMPAPPEPLPTRKLPETRQGENDKKLSAHLEAAVQSAHQAIVQAAAADPDNLGEAGCTLTLGLIIGRRLYLAHVGDSRAYLWRRSRLRQLTSDHSGAAMLVAAGVIEQEQARQHPGSSQLYRFLGGTDKQAQADVTTLDLETGDLLLLCSDGFWGMVPDQELVSLLISNQELEVLGQQCVESANNNGGEDNISVVLARII